MFWRFELGLVAGVLAVVWEVSGMFLEVFSGVFGRFVRMLLGHG